MFNKLIWFWNIVYYNLFIFENRVTSIFLYPFFKIFKSDKVKELYNKRGVDNPDLIIRDALTNPDYGTNSIKAGGIMGVIVLFFCLGFFCLHTGLYEKNLDLTITNLLVFGVISLVINYFFLFKDKRYLVYFKKISESSKAEKRKYAWLSLIFILFAIVFLVSSFMFMDYMLHK
ncbi:MAG: hypothetical protein ACOVNM_04520 [Flavobacterium sp.]